MNFKTVTVACVLACSSVGATVSTAEVPTVMALGGGIFDYQVGSEWGKYPVSARELATKGDVFKRLALRTAFFGSVGTSFYLGKFNGHHVMATNYHVMAIVGCCRTNAHFQALGKTYFSKREFGRWPLIDLSLFEIDVPREDEPLLRTLARNFDFDAPIYTGQKLLTMGHGVVTNPEVQRVVMANDDGDCKVFSGTNEFRPLGDPDAYSHVTYTAWSFANGCDVSHGDSGSPFVDRETGALLGLLWTARVPKPAQMGDSSYLNQLIRNQGPEIWTGLTYAVPAVMIRRILSGAIEADPTLDFDARATIGAIVRNQMD